MPRGQIYIICYSHQGANKHYLLNKSFLGIEGYCSSYTNNVLAQRRRLWAKVDIDTLLSQRGQGGFGARSIVSESEEPISGHVCIISYATEKDYNFISPERSA